MAIRDSYIKCVKRVAAKRRTFLNAQLNKSDRAYLAKNKSLDAKLRKMIHAESVAYGRGACSQDD